MQTKQTDGMTLGELKFLAYLLVQFEANYGANFTTPGTMAVRNEIRKGREILDYNDTTMVPGEVQL